MKPISQTRRSAQFPIVIAAIVCCFSGCRVLSPVPIDASRKYVAPELLNSNEPQIEIGKKHRYLDPVGNFFGIPAKLTLWDRRVDNHKISERTLLTMADYLESNNLGHVKVRANQYHPKDEWKRLRQNKTMSPLIRYTFGALSVARGAILPGRIFGGDHFNPYTQTIHLYSDVPAIALHEGGHAKDFSRREYQGLYTLAYSILPLWHETLATEDTFSYLETQGDPQMLAEADRILYPAYSTYVGSSLGNFSPAYSFPIYLGSLVLGHANGKILANQRMHDASSIAGGAINSDVKQVSYADPSSSSPSLTAP